MNKITGIWLGMMLMLLTVFQAFAGVHPPISFLDKNGDNVIEMAKEQGKKLVINGVTYYKGNPYSPEQTCGSCHDYESITSAYHFQLGATDMGDNWGKQHSEFHYDHLLSAGQYGSW